MSGAFDTFLGGDHGTSLFVSQGAGTDCGMPCGPCDRSDRPIVSRLPPDLAWTWFAFAQLDIDTLYQVLRLRQQVFIVEQDVPYPDIDEKDTICRHLVVRRDGTVVAYLRIVPKDVFALGCFSFGRVVVNDCVRRAGLGSCLVRRGIDHLDAIRGTAPIKISSQLYLRDFYASFGFIAQGTPYIEDRIPHIAMIRP